MPNELGIIPEPLYGMSINSNKPCMVPSSPLAPCNAKNAKSINPFKSSAFKVLPNFFINDFPLSAWADAKFSA